MHRPHLRVLPASLGWLSMLSALPLHAPGQRQRSLPELLAATARGRRRQDQRIGADSMARGSIQVRKGPRGVAYRVRVEYGPDPLTGRRKQRSKTFLVRREAEACLNRWQAEIERGIAVEP